MLRSDFDFELPQALIAQAPLAARSASRLLTLDGDNGDLQDRAFIDILSLLNAEDLLVFNNTRVLPARLFGVKQTGGRVEILIERLRADGVALAHVRASKSPKANSTIAITAGVDTDITDLSVRVEGREGALFILRPELGEWSEIMRRYGHIPLPPYIEREDNHDDRERYQTVFASRDGAVAAPTAGLHFDEALLADIRLKGVASVEVTLHVGAGTFQPVRADDIADHHMHAEAIEVTQAVCEAVEACRRRGGRVVAVGTTAVRSLESAAASGKLMPYSGDTDIFLYPGRPFHVVDAMITNFHLPESTLIMLVSAFAGRTHVLQAYAHAIRQQYRFFSYGDAMFMTANAQARQGGLNEV